MKIFPLAFLTFAFAAVAHAPAARAQEKFVAAQYDPFVGDWETQNPAAPVAQVIRTGSNAYTVNVLAAFDDDSDAAPIATLRGSLAAGANPQKDPVELSGAGGSASNSNSGSSNSGNSNGSSSNANTVWTGEMWPDCCSSPHLDLVTTNAQTQTKQILHLRHYTRPNSLLRAKPPAGATVLFGINGQNPDAWTSAANGKNLKTENLKPERENAPEQNSSLQPSVIQAFPWKLAESGYVLESVPGASAIASREIFGDQRVHLEFRFIGTPASARVLLQGVYRITLTESYARHDLPPSGVVEKTVKAGTDGLGIKPAARAARPVLEWQTLDIDFRAPRFDAKENGKIAAPASATVYLNNVLLYENVELAAPDGARASETPRGPLVLEERGAPVQFRNIWVR